MSAMPKIVRVEELVITSEQACPLRQFLAGFADAGDQGRSSPAIAHHVGRAATPSWHSVTRDRRRRIEIQTR